LQNRLEMFNFNIFLDWYYVFRGYILKNLSSVCMYWRVIIAANSNLQRYEIINFHLLLSFHVRVPDLWYKNLLAYKLEFHLAFPVYAYTKNGTSKLIFAPDTNLLAKKAVFRIRIRWMRIRIQGFGWIQIPDPDPGSQFLILIKQKNIYNCSLFRYFTAAILGCWTLCYLQKNLMKWSIRA